MRGRASAARAVARPGEENLVKRTGAMLLAAILAFALAAPVAAEVPANDWTSSTWTSLIGWVTGWAEDLGQAIAATTGLTETQAFPEIDPDGLQTQANPELDPDGSSTNAFPEIDPDG